MKTGNKFWIVLSLLIVFAAGFAGGLLFDNNILDKKPRRSDRQRSTVHFPSLELLAKELSLSAEQQEKLKEIFKKNEETLKATRNQVHEQYASIRAQLKKEMLEVLTEEQRAKFDAMIEKYRSERKREMEERKRRPRENANSMEKRDE